MLRYIRSVVFYAWAIAFGLTPLIQAGDAYPVKPDVPPGKERGAKALKGGNLQYWKDSPQQATVLAATFLGGKATEWLVSGGFQPDGSVVLAGNVCGGTLSIGSTTIGVLGTDSGRPGTETAFTDKNKPSWIHPDTTGFIALTSSDLKTVTKIVRFPWSSAAITSCAVGLDGSIYIAGKPGAAVASLGGAQRSLNVAPDSTRKGGMAQAAFLAKIDKTASKVEWLVTLTGLTDAPSVRLGKGDRVIFGAQDLRFFDTAGKETGQISVPGGVRETTAVNPIDGSIAVCGERNTGTGREPWRMGHLNILEPDGKLRYQLYQWLPSYVVLDTSRLVSDSPITQVAYDQNGNLFATMWSDGGNSVNVCQPTDIGRRGPNQGLGLNTAGANAGKFFYIVKMETTNYNLLGWTMWLARYGGKPNGAAVDTLCQVPDGSLAFSGGSAWGLVQTGNKLANGEPGGNFIAVLSPDFTTARYCSVVPGSGLAQLGNGNDAFGIGAGTVKGKSRVLFFSGANAEEEVYDLVTKTATINALQPTFGGGYADGYVVMLEMDNLPPVAAPVYTPPRLLIGRADTKSRSKTEITSTSFEWSDTLPKWSSADAEFRVADASKWPNFVIGKGASGKVDIVNGAPVGSFSVNFTAFCQSNGKQDRRVLGELFQNGKEPTLALSVTAFGAAENRTHTFVDHNGKSQENKITCYPVTATLTLNGNPLKIPFEAVYGLGTVVEKPWIKMQVSLFATVKGKTLGLSGELADKDIDIRIRTQGIDPATVVETPKKKK